MDTFKTDEEWLREYRASGNQLAFKAILDRYQLSICRMVASILGPDLAGEAEDVAQEVFLKVHRGLSRFRSDATFKTWLYRIAFNTSVSFKTRHKRRGKRLTDVGLLDVESKSGHPSDQLAARERNIELDRAMEDLPVEYQSAIRLFYWYQIPVAEIAEQLGANKNTIKSYLYRARKLLASQLTQYENEK